MKQVAQVLNSGEILVLDVPIPQVEAGCLLVRNEWSLISAGTERSKLEMGRKGLIGKAVARPDLVRQVIDKVRSEGVFATANTVKERLDALTPLGYSCAGSVAALGPGVRGFCVGDRVACAGAESAHHAEYVSVPSLLCAKVPDAVLTEAAAYTTVGCVALQGIRQADVRFGEQVLVIGLGLIGQLTLQLLRAAGCKAAGADVSAIQVDRARELGFPDCVLSSEQSAATTLFSSTSGSGFDAVLITAGAPDNSPVVLAGEVARDRARIVFVGATPVDAPRSPFYEKELSLHLSRSYGPGRYDPAYELHGNDYPIGYVRWTEQRNMEAFLSSLASGSVDVEALTSHRFPIEDAEAAYDTLGDHGSRSVGILLSYPMHEDQRPSPPGEDVLSASHAHTAGNGLAVVGVGNFATKVLLPAFKAAGGLVPEVVVSARGLSAADIARRHRIPHADSSSETAFARPGLAAAAIATRHDTHAVLAVQAMHAGLAVLVEKPLCRIPEELASIIDMQRQSGSLLMVGFNRRFAPSTRSLVELRRQSTGPCQVAIRVDAGAIPKSHWIQDPDIGGGRLVGEGCHFIDLVACIIGSPIEVVGARAMSSAQGLGLDDSFVITTHHHDGSVGTVVYSAEGSSRLGKERVELFCMGSTAVIDDFRQLVISKGTKIRRRRGAQDKGHREEVEVFSRAAVSGAPVDELSFEECVASTVATFACVEALRTGEWIRVDEYRSRILGE
jgi:polar amino acid transport system substrate-binding protein